MAIVTKKKANVGRCGICAGLSPRTGTLALVAVLCVGAVVWWIGAERTRGTEQIRGAAPTNLDREPGTGNRERGTASGQQQEGEQGTENGKTASGLRQSGAKQDGGEQEGEPQQDEPTKALTKEELWAIADSNRLAKSEAIMLANAPKKHFDNEVENTIEVISKPGAQFLQIPHVDMSQEEVLEFLNKPVEIYDDDDEETVAAKERTATFKQQALEFIKAGGTINQFIRDVVAEQTEARETVEEVRREKTRIVKEQGLEAAQAYLDEINPQLKEAGLPEVKLGRVDFKIVKDAEKERDLNMSGGN